MTKVARGEASERPEDVTHEVALPDNVDDDEDSNEDEEDKSMDVVMDIDGAQKKTTVKYEGEEELQSEEAGSFQVNLSEQGE